MKLSLGLGVNSTIIFRGVGSIVVVPSLSISLVDSDSVDYSTDSTGTFYWLLDTTASHTAAEVELGGGSASGSFAVTAGTTTEPIDLSAVVAGDYKFHAVIKDGDGDYSDVVTDDLIIEASASQVTVTEFDEQSISASQASYAFTVNLSTVPDGARCVLAFMARRVSSTAFNVTGVSGATHTVTSRVTNTNVAGGETVPVAIAEFTKQAGQTSDTITWTLDGTCNIARQWGGYLANAHATTVDDTATGDAGATDTVTASTALTTTNLGIALAIVGGMDASGQTYTWSPAGSTEHMDHGGLAGMSVASWPTDGTALTPSATASVASMDVLTLAAISIPPG